MKKLSQVAAVLALGAACAMPVMAQSSSTTDASSSTQSTAPTTQSMGAGPTDDGRPAQRDDGMDLGWLGLLGLAGLLGRRRNDRHVNHTATGHAGR